MTFFIVRSCRSLRNRTFREWKAIPPFSPCDGQLRLAWLLFTRPTKADMTNIKSTLVLSPNYLLQNSSAKTLIERETMVPQLLPFTCKFPNKRLVMGVFIALAENFTQNWFRIGCQVLEIASLRREESSLRFLHVSNSFKVGMKLLCWVFFFCRSNLFLPKLKQHGRVVKTL